MNQLMVNARRRQRVPVWKLFFEGETCQETPDLIQSVLNWFKTSNNTKFTA